MQTDARTSVFIYRGILPDGDLPSAMGRGRQHIVVNFSQDIFAHEHFEPGVSVTLYGHYLSVHEGEQLLDQARALGHQWYQGLPEDSYVYDGISLGAVAAYDFVIVFVEVLKSLRLAERIIEVYVVKPIRTTAAASQERLPAVVPRGAAFSDSLSVVLVTFAA